MIREKDPEKLSLRMGFGLGISGMTSPMGMGFGRDLMVRGLKECGRMGAMCRRLDLDVILRVSYVHL